MTNRRQLAGLLATASLILALLTSGLTAATSTSLPLLEESDCGEYDGNICEYEESCTGWWLWRKCKVVSAKYYELTDPDDGSGDKEEPQ